MSPHRGETGDRSRRRPRDASSEGTGRGVDEGYEPQGDSGVQEILRQEAEGIADRLEVLLDAGTPAAAAEALRLAHTLKGLAVATEADPLRDLARSVEGALARFDPDDEGRREDLLQAADAIRGLLAGVPGAHAAARTAAAVLAEASGGHPAPGVPWARRALFQRLQGHLEPAFASVEETLRGLERGPDNWRARAELARDVELAAAAAGLAGHDALSAVGLELASFLQERTPDAQAVAAARRTCDLLRELPGPDGLDTPLPPRVLSGLEALRATTHAVADEERIPLSVEFPWPDVDRPAGLLQAIDRATSGRSIVDARPVRPGCRFLSGALGLLPRRQARREGADIIRVPRRRLDRLQEIVEDVVGLRARARAMDRLAHKLAEAAPAGARLGMHRLAREAAELDFELDHVARSTQHAVLRARLVPLRGLFSLTRAAVREHLSRHPEQAVELEIKDASTRIDKGILDGLVDPLLHLLKNALIHGIEPRSERIARGKPETATIRLSARSTPAGVEVEVEDDGRGLDEERLSRTGEQQGLVLLRDEQEEGLALAFATGVSTAEVVTDDAGRGVGLMSVLERVRSLRGRLVYRSTPGVGTLARLLVPPAVSTARVLFVRVGTERFALPLTSVSEVREGSAVEAGLSVARLADLVDRPLHEERRRARGEAVHHERRMKDRFTVVVQPPFAAAGGQATRGLGCIVDDVLGRDLVVVRPLGRRFAPPGIDGAALFGDGRIVLVLDAWRLFISTQTKPYRLPRANAPERAEPRSDDAE